jgi:hypothetical protein
MSQKIKSITIAGQKFNVEQNSEIDLAGKADLVDGKVPLEQLPEPPAPAEWTEVEWVDFTTDSLVVPELDASKQIVVQVLENDSESLFFVELYNPKAGAQGYMATFYDPVMDEVSRIRFVFNLTTKTFSNYFIQTGDVSIIKVLYR